MTDPKESINKSLTQWLSDSKNSSFLLKTMEKCGGKSRSSPPALFIAEDNTVSSSPSSSVSSKSKLASQATNHRITPLSPPNISHPITAIRSKGDHLSPLQFHHSPLQSFKSSNSNSPLLSPGKGGSGNASPAKILPRSPSSKEFHLSPRLRRSSSGNGTSLYEMIGSPDATSPTNGGIFRSLSHQFAHASNDEIPLQSTANNNINMDDKIDISLILGMEKVSPNNEIDSTNLRTIVSKSDDIPTRESESGIKTFYFGVNAQPNCVTMQQWAKDLEIIETYFADCGIESMDAHTFRRVTTDICGFSSYCNRLLFQRIQSQTNSNLNTANPTIHKKQFIQFWRNNYCKIRDPFHRFFNLLRGYTPPIAQPQKHSTSLIIPQLLVPNNTEMTDFLTRDDFRPLLEEVVSRHPGLHFLQNSANFHSHYVDTVIGRIFYHINRRCNDKLTLTELRNSNFLDILHTLDSEDDINEIFDYFSYEHFYVIYCKFWELDSDHDFVLNKCDLAQYAEGSLTGSVIDRVLDGVPRKLSHGKGKMTYKEFIPFIISEEDKKNSVSVEYWFRVLDLDGDGILSAFELEYFFDEQMQRIKAISNESVAYTDFLCQLNDMIKPRKEAQFTLSDLKRSKLSHLFFDMLFNLNKFACYEQRDPYLLEEIRNTPQMTDWDRFASSEYARYADSDNDSDNSS